MDDMTLEAVREAGSVRDQGHPRRGRVQGRAGVVHLVSERRAGQPELGRHRAARGVLPARAVRGHREQARARPAAGRGRHAEDTGYRRAARSLDEEARTTPGAPLLQARCFERGEDARLRSGHVRARAGGGHHRRPLSGAGPHAGAPNRSSTSTWWAMCGKPRPRHVQAVRGRGRHRRDVLHLRVAEKQPDPQPRRHDCARRADLHSVPRDGAPGGLRPQVRRGARQTGGPISVLG